MPHTACATHEQTNKHINKRTHLVMPRVWSWYQRLVLRWVLGCSATHEAGSHSCPVCSAERLAKVAYSVPVVV